MPNKVRFILLFAILISLSVANATAETITAESSTSEMFSDESLQAIAASVIADEENNQWQPDGQASSSDKPYWAMVAWLAAATIYDVESTFYRLNRCDECSEANPIVRPFIERGRFATYAYSAAVNGIVMYFAKRMYDRGHPWWRVFAVTLAVVHGVAGTVNVYLAGHGDN